MESIRATDLKNILHSKRANLYYLEHCRRCGGLVFDAADLVKDAVILPQAFLSAMRGDDEQQFRRQCIETLTRDESLDFMIDTLKTIALDTAGLAISAQAGT